MLNGFLAGAFVIGVGLLIFKRGLRLAGLGLAIAAVALFDTEEPGFDAGQTGNTGRQNTSQTEALRKAEDKRKGFHCLSPWDGSHRQFRDMVLDRLRDPGSFEHISTRVTPVDEAGTHRIFMDYRARNGFGGMNVGLASGTYRNADCTPTILSVE